jgi:hypothetical protein
MSDMGRIYIVPDTIAQPDVYFEASERLLMEACYPSFIELVAVFQRGRTGVRLFLVCEADDTIALDWYASCGLVFPAKDGPDSDVHAGMMKHVTMAAEKLVENGTVKSLDYAMSALRFMMRKGHLKKEWLR